MLIHLTIHHTVAWRGNEYCWTCVFITMYYDIKLTRIFNQLEDELFSWWKNILCCLKLSVSDVNILKDFWLKLYEFWEMCTIFICIHVIPSTKAICDIFQRWNQDMRLFCSYVGYHAHKRNSIYETLCMVSFRKHPKRLTNFWKSYSRQNTLERFRRLSSLSKKCVLGSKTRHGVIRKH